MIVGTCDRRIERGIRRDERKRRWHARALVSTGNKFKFGAGKETLSTFPFLSPTSKAPEQIYNQRCWKLFQVEGVITPLLDDAVLGFDVCDCGSFGCETLPIVVVLDVKLSLEE